MHLRIRDMVALMLFAGLISNILVVAGVTRGPAAWGWFPGIFVDAAVFAGVAAWCWFSLPRE